MSYLIILVTVLSFVSAVPLPGNGILQPPLHYQRFRYKEYKQYVPYYQWWYYWVRDTKSDRHFAITYGTTFCKNTDVKCNYDGAFISFALVDNKRNKRLQKYEFYNRDTLNVSQEFHLQLRTSNNSDAVYEILPLSNDVIKLRGSMRKENIENVWACEGCPKDLLIEWDIKLTRIYGYYAQDIFEVPDKWLEGIIMWNTYAHTSEVEGTVKIGNDTFTLARNKDFRAYGDGNWGEIMPSSPPKQPPSAKYAWGWYFINIPSEDKTQELSIIAGTGLSYADAFLRTMDGRFSDIRLNNKTHVELRLMKVWDIQFDSCNDGQLRKFEVERSNWANITDSFGNASIPLRQVVTLESDTYHIIMDFNSVIGNYNRLLFPYTSYVFSDFEGLGVSTKVTIIDKKSGKAFFNGTVNTGGLEYGYRFDINVPPVPKH